MIVVACGHRIPGISGLEVWGGFEGAGDQFEKVYDDPQLCGVQDRLSFKRCRVKGVRRFGFTLVA